MNSCITCSENLGLDGICPGYVQGLKAGVEPLLTPYYFNLIEVDDLPVTVPIARNFELYQLFVITTRLRPHVPPECDITYDQIAYRGKAVVTVNITRDGTLIDLDRQQTLRYQEILQTIYTHNPEFCLLLDANYLTSTTYTYGWVSMLPSLVPELGKLEGDQIYVNLDGPDYSYIWNELYDSLLTELRKRWQLGVIYLDPILDAEMIPLWQLQRYQNTNLYYPKWKNERVGDLVPFLEARLRQEEHMTLELPFLTDDDRQILSNNLPFTLEFWEMPCLFQLLTIFNLLITWIEFINFSVLLPLLLLLLLIIKMESLFNNSSYCSDNQLLEYINISITQYLIISITQLLLSTSTVRLSITELSIT